MKNQSLTLIAALLFFVFNLTTSCRHNSSSKHDGKSEFSSEDKDEREEEGEEGENEENEKQSGAGRQLMSWFQAKGYPDASNMSEKYQTAWEQFEKSKNTGYMARPNGVTSNWTQLGYSVNGATRIGGRIVCMAIDPNNSNNLWVGSGSGGMYKSTNAGTSWTNVVTNLPVLGVSSIIIDPSNSNIIYAGTGELYSTEYTYNNTGFNVWKTRGTYGIGVIKSTDGGVTWAQIMPKISSNLFAINMLAFQPGNSSTIYACASDGLFRSTNSGIGWTKIYNGVNVRDIAINPSNTDQIVITVGNLTNPTKGVFRTTNGNNATPTWNAISGGWPSNFAGYINLDNVGSAVLAASVGVSSTGTPNEIYSSTDFGATWSVLSNSNHCSYQFWFAHTVAINPFSTDSIMYGGVYLYRHKTTGSKATINGPHADQHDIKFDPARRGVVYVCNDGGVYKSTNGGSSFTAINNGINATQFFASLGVSKTNANLMVGGLQDNGQVVYNGTNWITPTGAGGDGTACAIHPSDNNILLASRDARAIKLSTDGGSSFSELTNSSWAFAGDSRTAFCAPIAFAPSNGNIVYQASDNLHKSTNAGSSFSNNTLGTGSPATTPNNFIEAIHKTAIALAVSPTNENKVYVSTSPFAQYDNDDNRLYVTGTPNILKTTSGGTPFASIKGSLPDRFVMDFAISKFNDDSVYIVLGGFGTSHVYLTPDGGTTWQSIDVGLPDVPFNAIVIDPVNPKTIYAGCDFGVFVSPDRGANWYNFSNGFTDATLVMDLQIDANKKLIAATHGRGVYRSDLYTNSTLPVTLREFSGVALQGQNKLHWIVEQELNLSKYELERSANGVDFTKINTQTASGKTTYEYYDTRPLFEGFYRLKMIDLDGSYKYSSVVFLRAAQATPEFTVVGNPFTETLVLKYKVPKDAKLDLQLYNMAGALMLRREYNMSGGIGYYTINGVSSLSSGTYILKINYGQETQSLKVQKR